METNEMDGAFGVSLPAQDATVAPPPLEVAMSDIPPASPAANAEMINVNVQSCVASYGASTDAQAFFDVTFSVCVMDPASSPAQYLIVKRIAVDKVTLAQEALARGVTLVEEKKKEPEAGILTTDRMCRIAGVKRN